MLRQAASRLKRCVRETDTVTRLGGDEFTIILSQIRSARDPESAALNVVNALAQPFAIGGAEHLVSASIGIAVYPEDGRSADELVRNADTAMYRAKDSGGNSFELCTPELTAAAVERLELQNGLRLALDRNEFLLH